MHFKSLTKLPPQKWHYTQPETNHFMVDITFGGLLKQIAQHRANMKLPTNGRLSDEIELAICQSLSPEDQVALCNGGVRAVKSVAWQQVESFFKTMAAWIGSGKEPVPQPEAERRAAICAKCPLNVGLSGCAVCRIALEEFRKKLTGLGNRQTSQDKSLLACGVCGCDNKSQVHVPLKALRAGTGDLAYPAWCWKAHGGQHTIEE